MPLAQLSSIPLRRRLSVFMTRWHRLIRIACDPYRPELHYMRGPGRSGTPSAKAASEAARFEPRRRRGSIPSALMRSPHHLHGVLDMTPLPGFFRLALALASQGMAGRFGDSVEAMPLEHLPRDGVDLHLGCHLTLP